MSVPKSSQPGWSSVVISIIGIVFAVFMQQNYHSAARRQILCSIIFVKNNIFGLSSRCNMYVAVSVHCARLQKKEEYGLSETA